MTADAYARLDAAYLSARLRSRTSRSPSPTGPPSSAWRCPGQPGESREVAGVVDTMDGGKSAAVPLDLVDAGGAKI